MFTSGYSSTDLLIFLRLAADRLIRKRVYVRLFYDYTYMAKLTLSVDAQVILRAKKHAKERGVSLSQTVESYLAAVMEPSRRSDATPVLHSLRGALRNADVEEYRKHLRSKYR